MGKCVGGGADGGCADGTGGGDGSVVVLVGLHSSNDGFAGTVVLFGAGDGAGAGVSFLRFFAGDFRGGSFRGFASGSVLVVEHFPMLEVVAVVVPESLLHVHVLSWPC